MLPPQLAPFLTSTLRLQHRALARQLISLGRVAQFCKAQNELSCSLAKARRTTHCMHDAHAVDISRDSIGRATSRIRAFLHGRKNLATSLSRFQLLESMSDDDASARRLDACSAEDASTAAVSAHPARLVNE